MINDSIWNRTSIAEMNVLGSLILDNSSFAEVSKLISVESFHWVQNQLIFKTIAQQLQAGQFVDLVTLSQSSEIDLQYIGRIVRETVSTANVLAYAEIVNREAERRHIDSLLQDAQESLTTEHDPKDTLLALMDRAEKSFLAGKPKGGFMFATIADISLT